MKSAEVAIFQYLGSPNLLTSLIIAFEKLPIAPAIVSYQENIYTYSSDQRSDFVFRTSLADREMIIPTVALGPILPLMSTMETIIPISIAAHPFPILPLWPLCHDNLVIRPEEYLNQADYGLGGACSRGGDVAGDVAPWSAEGVIFSIKEVLKESKVRKAFLVEKSHISEI